MAAILAGYAAVVLLISFVLPISENTRDLLATAAAALAATIVVAPALWAATLIADRGSRRSWLLIAAATIALAAAELLAVFSAVASDDRPAPSGISALLAIGGALGLAAVAAVPLPATSRETRARFLIDATLAAAAFVLGWLVLAAQASSATNASTGIWLIVAISALTPLAAAVGNAMVAIATAAARRQEAALLAAAWLLVTAAAAGDGLVLLDESRSTGSWTDWLVPAAMAALSIAAIRAIRTVAEAHPVSDSPVTPALAFPGDRGVVASALPYVVFGAAVALAVLVRSPRALTPILAGIGLSIAALIVARQMLGARLTERLTTMLEVARSDLERQARIDPVTELPNRRALMERLQEEVERAVRYTDPLSVCFIDLDRFKSVNDTYGHAAGDLVLREVGALLRRSARTVDFVSRYGGEEFVVLLPETWTVDALVMAERARRMVQAHRFVLPDGTTLRLSVSAGVAGLPEHATEAASLLDRADRALYAAKAAGRNRVALFDPETDTGTIVGDDIP